MFTVIENPQDPKELIQVLKIKPFVIGYFNDSIEPSNNTLTHFFNSFFLQTIKNYFQENNIGLFYIDTNTITVCSLPPLLRQSMPVVLPNFAVYDKQGTFKGDFDILNMDDSIKYSTKPLIPAGTLIGKVDFLYK